MYSLAARLERQMRRLSTTTIGMMAWSKRVCVLLVVSLLFDLISIRGVSDSPNGSFVSSVVATAAPRRAAAR